MHFLCVKPFVNFVSFALGELMVPVEPNETAASTTSSSGAASTSTESSGEEKREEPEETKGDPEMAPVYLKSLLPVFARNYLGTMLPSVRKATLALMRKMVHFTAQPLLQELSQTPNFASVIVEVLAVVLDHEVNTPVVLLLIRTNRKTANLQSWKCNCVLNNLEQN